MTAPAFEVTAIELVIQGQEYRVSRNMLPEERGRSYRLEKIPISICQSYTVSPTDCSCPHSQYRKPAEGCKHRQALAAIGIEKLMPLAAPEPKRCCGAPD